MCYKFQFFENFKYLNFDGILNIQAKSVFCCPLDSHVLMSSSQRYVWVSRVPATSAAVLRCIHSVALSNVNVLSSDAVGPQLFIALNDDLVGLNSPKARVWF